MKNLHQPTDFAEEPNYESDSDCHDALAKVLGDVSARSDGKALLATWINTPLGSMISVVDESYLYLLEFVDKRGLEKEIERLRQKLKIGVIPGQTHITNQIKTELLNYFSGKSYEFQTPYFFLGSAFEKSVWEALKLIPVGQTCSYLTIAKTIGNPKAFRAVANANGKNQLAIIIPCHRVINENGELGGYAGGLTRKQWLINHER